MTRDEVMLMTDVELRIKADELLLPGNKIAWFCDRLARFYGDLDYDWLPDYPNDIAAAWGLFLRLIDMRDHCQIHTDNGAACRCWDVRSSEDCFANEIVGEANWEEDMTRPVCRAITRAFILTMEANDD